MIVFEVVRFKNFLSTGDSFTEVPLNRNATTLIVGHNGAGKSTMLDALSFALFGKPHRNINKPQLVNSINQKHCLVEVEFRIGKSKFLVRRGIKPGIFEVYQNGHMLNQESHNRDYQKQLEKNILKLNHKSFHQIVVLGSSSFIPFMQLPVGVRREVIEDLLDINVFSRMNQILKEKSGKIRENIKDVTYQIDMCKEKLDLQENHIEELKRLSKKETEKNKNKIKEHKEQIALLLANNEELSKEITDDSSVLEKDRKALADLHSSLSSERSVINNEIRNMAKEAMFYDKHDTCPTCAQDIASELKSERKSHLKSTAESEAKKLKQIEADMDAAAKKLKDIQASIQHINSIQNKISENNAVIAQHNNQINLLEKEEDSGPSKADIKKAEKVLSDLIKDRELYTEKKLELVDERMYNEAMAEMLKDTGIKTKIIKQYLPVMNKLINNYLQILDFFVSFNINENFEETIKSRHRDEFTYPSFSEGEKMKIDLALLFTWRHIAKMKNSISTNLLVLDETFDSSLDGDGLENLEKIINTLGTGTNTFIISHRRDELDSKFEQKIEFVKENNFSEMRVAQCIKKDTKGEKT